MTDSSDLTKDFTTGERTIKDISNNTLSRKRRDVESHLNASSVPDKISSRNDNDQEMEYIEFDPESDEDEYQDDELDDSERGKRQIRFYIKEGHKVPLKFTSSKPVKFVNLRHNNQNPNIHNPRYHTNHNSGFNDNTYTSFVVTNNNNHYPVSGHVNYQTVDHYQNQRPFKASLPDLSKPKYLPNNAGTQIITKSPPISSLNNNQNPFASLAGGFYNNALKNDHNTISQGQISSVKPNLSSPHDLTHFPSTIVTGRPLSSSTQSLNYNVKNDEENKKLNNVYKNNNNKFTKDEDYNEDEDYSDEEAESSEEDEEDHKPNFSPPITVPYSFNHPRNKYANIDNPFARPNFNFDEFLAKLRDDQYSVIGLSTQKPKALQNNDVQTDSPINTNPSINSHKISSFKGISTPKPFTMSDVPQNLTLAINENIKNFAPQHGSDYVLRSQITTHNNNPYFQHNSKNVNRLPQKDAGIPLETLKPKLKLPNFQDNRPVSINYNFNTPAEGSNQPSNTIRPIVTQTSYYSTPNNNNKLPLQSHHINNAKPFLVSTSPPFNRYVLSISQSTPRPATFVNQQVSPVQNYWKKPSIAFTPTTPSSISPNTVTEIAKWTKLYSQAIQSSTIIPLSGKNIVADVSTKAPPKRKPIPKPSPEMNDYYYDDEDEQYYYEPIVKPKYMPSSEVMPQRPPMAQNYEEYDDSNEQLEIHTDSKIQEHQKIPSSQNNFKVESATKNHNDVSVVTKSPYKQSNKIINGKIPVPVMVDYDDSTNSMSHNSRNRTYYLRKPNKPENNPNTLKPPKYLNQTTLRPYTVRHRLAMPTTEKNQVNQDVENKQMRGRIRHHNIVAEMKLTTPHDSFKQETRITKTGHDDKTNR